MAESMKFQCIMCFSMNEITRDMLGLQHQCPSCGKVMQLPNSSFASGRVIADDFVLKRKIGSGAMGSVFLAHQLSMDRDVAVKILFFQYTKDQKYYEDFNREARAAARLNHINIVQSLAFGVEKDIMYTAMQYIEGTTLEKLLKLRKKLPLDDALNIAQQVAEALHCGWTEMQLVHRDIKPGNIIITKDGIVKLCDFGLARTAADVPTDVVSGTPAYMSPEQFTRGEIDCRSDIYSLGVALFEMLSGELPFKGESASQVGRKHLNDPLPLNKIKPPPTRKVKTLLRKATSKNQADRFQTPEELLNSIVAIRKRLALDKAAVSSVHTMSFERQNLLEPQRANKLKTLAEVDEDYQKYEDEKKLKLHYVYIAALSAIFITLILISSLMGTKDSKKQLAHIKSEVVKLTAGIGEQIDEKLKKIDEGFKQKLTNTLDRALFDRPQDLGGEETAKIFGRIEKAEKENSKKIDSLAKLVEKLSKKITTEKSVAKPVKKREPVKVKRVAGTDERLLKSHITYMLLNHTVKGNYLTAKLLLNSLSSSSKNDKVHEWLDNRLDELKNVDEFVDYLEDNKGILVGQEINSGTISSYSGNSQTLLVFKSASEGNSSKPVEMQLKDVPAKELEDLLLNARVVNHEIAKHVPLFYLYSQKFSEALMVSLTPEKEAAIIQFYFEYAQGELNELKKMVDPTHKSVKSKEARLKEVFSGTKWEEKID